MLLYFEIQLCASLLLTLNEKTQKTMMIQRKRWCIQGALTTAATRNQWLCNWIQRNKLSHLSRNHSLSPVKNTPRYLHDRYTHLYHIHSHLQSFTLKTQLGVADAVFTRHHLDCCNSLLHSLSDSLSQSTCCSELHHADATAAAPASVPASSPHLAHILTFNHSHSKQLFWLSD